MSSATARLAHRDNGVVESPPVDGLRQIPQPGEQPLEPIEKERRRYRSRVTAVHATWALVFGYVVLHPVAMAAFAWFELRGGPGGWQPVIARALESFSPAMLPMGLVFAVFSLVIGAMNGYYGAVVRFQRDDLARQLEVNQKYRRELEARNTALRELEKTKRRMTQFLVHDLKNHVGCVLGYTNLLLNRARKDGWEKRDEDALTAVNRQATRMEAAVKDVLELARLEHQPQVKLQNAPVVVILREAMAASALGPGQGTVLVNDDVPPDLVVDCDPALVVRVLANLVVNAVKHNGDEVAVTVGAYHDSWSVVFTCTDTGHGIPDAIRDRLFDEFISSSREQKSTPSYGLGLAFCKAAVEAHGGRIWFESEAGAGTTFFVAIPKTGIGTRSGEALNRPEPESRTLDHERRRQSHG
jgi:signal transduction histidine kinase